MFEKSKCWHCKVLSSVFNTRASWCTFKRKPTGSVNCQWFFHTNIAKCFFYSNWFLERHHTLKLVCASHTKRPPQDILWTSCLAQILMSLKYEHSNNCSDAVTKKHTIVFENKQNKSFYRKRSVLIFLNPFMPSKCLFSCTVVHFYWLRWFMKTKVSLKTRHYLNR